jgi:hypothetical protein
VIPVDTRRTVVKRTAIAACGLLVASALAGCGAGQISQTATQEPAVNGSLATFNNVALRNVHIQAVETGDALEPGQAVPLMFIASNQSPDKNDQLISITTDIGQVSITGDTELPAGGVLVVGAPDGVTELSNVEAADASERGIGDAEQAGPQWPDLRLHLPVCWSRRAHRSRAHLGGQRAPPTRSPLTLRR